MILWLFRICPHFSSPGHVEPSRAPPLALTATFVDAGVEVEEQQHQESADAQPEHEHDIWGIEICAVAGCESKFNVPEPPQPTPLTNDLDVV